MAVEQKFIGDSSQLVREYEKILAMNARMQAAMQSAVDKSKKANDEQKSMFGSLGRQMNSNITALASMASGYVSVAAAVGMAVRETQKLIDLQNRQKTVQLSVANAQAAAITNLGPKATQAQIDKLTAGVEQAAKASGVNQAAIYSAVGNTLSASNGNLELALAITSQAAPIFRGDPASLAEFASRVPAIMDNAGLNDPRAAIAYMASLQGSARITNLSAFKNVNRALASGAVSQTSPDLMGETVATGALFAGIGRRLDDAEGAITATAVAKLGNVLQTVVGGDLNSIERLSQVQADPKLQKQVLKLFGENEATSVIKELLSGGISAGFVNEAFPALQSSIPDFENLKRNLSEGTPQLKLSTRVGMSGASTEAYDLNSPGGWDAFARDRFNTAIERVPSFLGITKALGQTAYDYPISLDLSGELRKRYDSGYSENIDTGIATLEARRSGLVDSSGTPASGMSEVVRVLDEVVEELKYANEQRRKVVENTRRTSQTVPALQKNIHQERD